MVERFFLWYYGYVLVQLEGVAKERFFNLCRRGNFHIWNVHMEKDMCICYIALPDFWELGHIVRKTHVRPIILKRKGWPFLLERVWKQKGCLLGVISGGILIYGLSLFVWNISFQGQSLYTEEMLLKYLQSIHVETGMRLSKVDCKKIEDSLRKKYQNIGWVSAELNGTKLAISIVETKVPDLIKMKDGGYHIVAPEAGVVTAIVTRAGTPLVKKGDKVKAGDILISGVISYMNDGGEITKKETVCADGDVKLRTKKKYSKSCVLLHKEKQYTSFEKKVYELWIFGKKIYITNPFKGFNKGKKYDIMANVCNVSINKSFCMPMSYGTTMYKEYEEIEETYTEEEAKEILLQQYKQYKEKLIQNEKEVKEKEITFQKKENCVEISTQLIIEEVVKKYQKVQDEEWRLEQVNEFDGDND